MPSPCPPPVPPLTLPWVLMIRDAASALCGPADPDWLPLAMVAIAAHESAWGRRAPGGHNYIGYMWQDGHGWPYVEAQESISRTTRRFRTFDSPFGCMNALYYLIRSSSLQGYAAARRSLVPPGDPEAFLRTFAREYCPLDPNWPVDVLAILSGFIATF